MEVIYFVDILPVCEALVSHHLMGLIAGLMERKCNGKKLLQLLVPVHHI